MVIIRNILIGWILTVCLVDHYYSIKYQETLLSLERNPVGTFLIEADHGSVALFMSIKVGIIWFVVLCIIGLWRWSKGKTLLILTVLSLVQLYVMYMLLFADCLPPAKLCNDEKRYTSRNLSP